MFKTLAHHLFSINGVILSLIFAICLYASDGSLTSALLLSTVELKNTLLGNTYLNTALFLLSLGILIELMVHAGGVRAYTKMLKPYAKTPYRVSTLTLVAANIFFIDDYLNALTVGAMMRPLFKVHRVSSKWLSYLLNATASSFCVLVPFSSWTAMIVGQLQSLKVNCLLPDQSAYTIYLAAIPFFAYPLMSIFTAWTKRSTSLDYVEEKLAHDPLHDDPVLLKGSIAGFILPLGIFLITALVRMWHLSAWSTQLYDLLAVDMLLAFSQAALFSLGASTIFFLSKKQLQLHELPVIVRDGWKMMNASLMLLLLAWTLGSCLSIHLGLSACVSNNTIYVPGLLFLAGVIFVAGVLLTALAGSAWGSISLLLPVAIAAAQGIDDSIMAIAVPLLIGAVISGAIGGSHLSPLADGAVITSTSAHVSVVDHIKTMAPIATKNIIYCALYFVAIGALIVSYGSSLGYIGLVGISIASHALWLTARYFVENKLKRA